MYRRERVYYISNKRHWSINVWRVTLIWYRNTGWGMPTFNDALALWINLGKCVLIIDKV